MLQGHAHDKKYKRENGNNKTNMKIGNTMVYFIIK